MAGNNSVEANDFVTKLKADGTERDMCDLKKVHVQFKSILSGLITKDRGSFSLNVLCILCRNIEKVPSWKERICNKTLLELSIDCLRQTRVLDKPEQVKTLACVYHIHRYIVRQDTRLPPELVLKLSYIPFEVTNDHILVDYYKTYWSILADRLVYIERLKTERLSIVKLLPKLTEDISSIFNLYDTAQLCLNILPFIIKKLHVLYSDTCAKDLNGVYRSIFKCISIQDDLKSFKHMTAKDALDLYIKFNECLCIIIEDELKIHFKETTLDAVVRLMTSLLGSHPEIYHCFQTIYYNCFCCIFKSDIDSNYADMALQKLYASFETTEKLGYVKSIYISYPYVAQLLRLYIEYNINISKNTSIGSFGVSVLDDCLKITFVLMKKLYKTQQLSKCDGCNARTGLHDSLRLAFTTTKVIPTYMNNGIDLTKILPAFLNIVELKYTILTELNRLGCCNYAKCLKKLQTDVHNTAIVLNKAKCYDYSIKLFGVYLKNEIRNIRNDSEFKNIARALYNKGISELDCKLYEDAIKSAYLSLVFSGAEGMASDKYMSLVMDIKAKVLKQHEDNEENNQGLQILTVLSVCKMLAASNDYGNLKPYLSTLKFRQLLRHEFSMYVKLWPSVLPIAGVWISLNELSNKQHDSWLTADNEEAVRWSLYEVMLETPTAVRSIHSDHYKTIVSEVLQRFRRNPVRF